MSVVFYKLNQLSVLLITESNIALTKCRLHSRTVCAQPDDWLENCFLTDLDQSGGWTQQRASPLPGDCLLSANPVSNFLFLFLNYQGSFHRESYWKENFNDQTLSPFPTICSESDKSQQDEYIFRSIILNLSPQAERDSIIQRRIKMAFKGTVQRDGSGRNQAHSIGLY